MFELILCIDQKNGIGLNNNMPWKCNEELSIFKKLTQDKIVVVGKNTLINLPYLKNRDIYCLSRIKEHTDSFLLRNMYYNIIKNKFTLINNLDELLLIDDKKIIICGGNQVYTHVLSNPKYIDTIYLSIMKNTYNCDIFFDLKLLNDFIIIEKSEYDEFIHYKLKRTQNGEHQYLNLLDKILQNGVEKFGRNGKTLSLFTEHFKFDLRNGFPLLTTKKMFLRGIVEEFLFFMRGETDSNILSEKNVKIWEENTSEDFIDKRGLNYAKGVMGPMYGYQFRYFGAKYLLDENKKPLKPIGGIDQIENIINLIKTDPNSRRILLTSYNPTQSEEGVLYPCHSIAIQFYVDEQYLDIFCFNRSQDVFLGLPYNIASTSLLLILISKLTNKTPRFLNMTLGDVHIYNEHIECVLEQKNRLPFKFPNININNIETLNDINKLKYEDFVIKDYISHNMIKSKMIA